MNKIEVLLQVRALNTKSNILFWIAVLLMVIMALSIVAMFYIGTHFVLLGTASYIAARFIVMPKGIELNQKATDLLNSISD